MIYRISLTMFTIVGGCMLIALIFIDYSVDMLYQAGKNESKHLVQVAYNSIKPLIDRQKEGGLSKDEALNRAIKMLRKMIYIDQFGDNYIFMSDYSGTMLVQPFEPDLQGSNQWNMQDARGNYLIRDLVETARNRGEGYVEYYYLPPGRKKVQRKISYVIGIPEWSVYLGTGMYTEDVELFHTNSLKIAMIITVVLTVITALTSILLLRPVLRCYTGLQNMFQKIRQQPNELPRHVPNPFRIGSNEWNMMDRFRDMLEELVGSRERLRRRQNELEHLSRAASLGEMTAVIAHEINQPLAAIGSNASAASNLLSSGRADEAQIKEILQDIISDNKRASDVIRSIRIMLIKGEYQLDRLDLAALLTDTLSFIKALFSSSSFAIEADLDRKGMVVNGNWVQLQQVIVNLVMNAIEHLPGNGNGKVLIRSKAISAEEIQIEVIDNGTGMEASCLEKIFEPFFSLKKDGMGMGLAICRTIIETHHGTITSRLGSNQGMIFTITLPLAKDA